MKQLQDVIVENESAFYITNQNYPRSAVIFDLFITSEPTRYIEVGCRDCCLGDLQPVYGLWKSRKKEKSGSLNYRSPVQGKEPPMEEGKAN